MSTLTPYYRSLLRKAYPHLQGVDYRTDPGSYEAALADYNQYGKYIYQAKQAERRRQARPAQGLVRTIFANVKRRNAPARITSDKTGATFKGVREVSMTVPKSMSNNLLIAIPKLAQTLRTVLTQQLERLNQGHFYKAHLRMTVKAWDTQSDPIKLITRDFTGRASQIVSEHDIDSMIDKFSLIESGDDLFDHFEVAREGSNNVPFHSIVTTSVMMSSFKPLKGSSYKPLPPCIAAKKAIVNVQNNDNSCFMWAVLAALHPACKHAERVSKYVPYTSELNFTGINMPVAVKDIPKFEKLNNISINIYSLSETGNNVIPAHISQLSLNKHVDLMLHDGHYSWIKSLDRLLNTGNGHTMYHCPRCLHGYTTKELRDQHAARCVEVDPVRTVMPKRDTIEFKNTKPAVPVRIYADFESILVKCNETFGSKGSRKIEKHQPASYCIKVEADDPSLCSMHTYVGADAHTHFISKLDSLTKPLVKYMTANLPMKMTLKDEEEFKLATQCHMCKQPLGSDRVRHHCHQTGRYIGCCHTDCNLRSQVGRIKIPVILHNLSGYDAHHLLRALAIMGDDKWNAGINCIAENSEKMKSFGYGCYRFIDSARFLNASLDTLSSNLIAGDSTNAPRFHKHFVDRIGATNMNRYTRKGYYPYSWFDSLERLDETALPPRTAFKDSITKTTCTTEEYKHAQWVWETAGCKTFKDYHDLYLMGDVLLLADVFESFRQLAINTYECDPACYISLPSFAFDALLKMNQSNPGMKPLELLKDPDMYAFYERGIRGGVSQISTRYAKANNPYMADYDPSKEKSYISYLDACNLYGHSMSQYLPTHGFMWANDITLDEVLSGDWTGEDGLSVEADIEYPAELHDLHNDLPLAPETILTDESSVSPYLKSMHPDKKVVACRKLAGHFNTRVRYVCDARNLQYYVSKGMICTKIHRAIRCKQQQFIRDWIEKNTAMRAAAKNDFEKDFYKLMNNSVFGKTMEDVRKYSSFRLCTSEQQRLKYTARPTYKSCTPYGDDIATSKLAGIDLRPEMVELCKPIYMGASILDLSKIHMFRFHYDTMLPRYGQDKLKLLFTDTDSLTFHIQTDDVYADIAEMQDQFDTSAFPKDHPLYSSKNKKVIGRFTDECVDGVFAQMTEFVGLKPKMYACKIQQIGGAGGTTQKKVCKGVKKNIIRKTLNFDMYKRALEGETIHVQQRGIRSRKHCISTDQVTKVGLCGFDNKRWVCDDGISTLAHGHHRIQAAA
jgi:hypothetical protein